MYKHYIAVDWSQSSMVVARMSAKSERIWVQTWPAQVKLLQDYLKRLHGQIILALEESACSQWLYTELKGCVTELIICDPYRNHLLKEGPKTDRIDAKKLVRLLRADLLKPVYHSGDAFIYLRRMVRGYINLIKASTRLKNQRTALFQQNGQNPKFDELKGSSELFVAEGIDRALELYAAEKERYEAEFKRLSGKHLMIRQLKSLPGIGDIGAVKVAALVVDPRRFKTRNHFLSYCGLVRHERLSGGRSYGQKKPRYCRALKEVFKIAACASIGSGKRNPMQSYFVHLIQEKRLANHHASHKVCRRIATLALGILKSRQKFELRKGQIFKQKL